MGAAHGKYLLWSPWMPSHHGLATPSASQLTYGLMVELLPLDEPSCCRFTNSLSETFLSIASLGIGYREHLHLWRWILITKSESRSAGCRFGSWTSNRLQHLLCSRITVTLRCVSLCRQKANSCIYPGTLSYIPSMEPAVELQGWLVSLKQPVSNSVLLQLSKRRDLTIRFGRHCLKDMI